MRLRGHFGAMRGRRAVLAALALAAMGALAARAPAQAQDGFQGVRPVPAPAPAPAPRPSAPAGNPAPARRPPEAPLHWLVGRWEGDVARLRDARFGPHRILLIHAVDAQGRVTGDWAGDRNLPPSPAVIALDGDVVTVTNVLGTTVTLRQVGIDRLEGSFNVPNGPNRGSYAIVMERVGR
jgi:endonuclease YncB( thermonuclease family)